MGSFPMSDAPSGEPLDLAGAFDPVDYATWRKKAEADLKGASFDKRLVRRTPERLTLQPIYTSEDAAPGPRPLGRGARPWDVRQAVWTPDPAAAGAALGTDLAEGASSVLIQAADPLREGAEGVVVADGADLDTLLEPLPEGAAIELAVGAGAPGVAALLAARQREDARGCYGVDPIGALAMAGSLPWSKRRALGVAADFALWTAANRPGVRAIKVDSAPWHYAGATATQELGAVLATGVAYLEALTGVGMSPSEAAAQISFGLRLGSEVFAEIAKMRAMRALWAKVLEACGVTSGGAVMELSVATSARVLTRRDPWVNMLRNTAACFAGAVGGADIVVLAPFDALLGEPDALGRRVARNTQLVLMHESHLAGVADPAGGSWFIEHLTQALAAGAWNEFQALQAEGGVLATLLSGRLKARIDDAWIEREKRIAKRKTPITGVSEFPHIHEAPVERPTPDASAPRERSARRLAARAPSEARDAALAQVAEAEGADRIQALVDAAAEGASAAELVAALGTSAEPLRAEPLDVRTFAAGFEALRDASEATPERPQVFLASLGPVAHYTARATWAKNFFEAGGLEASDRGGHADGAAAAAAFAQSGATLACVCSSDKVYADHAASTARALKAAGASQVLLAGRPGEHEDAWREAGVDRFIYVGCDVLGTLRELLKAEGVLA